MARQSTGKRLRFEVFKRDGFRCVYCGVTSLNAVLHVDHVKPVAEGGESDASNLVTACQDCNGGKSSVPLDERKLRGSFANEDDREHAEQIREYLSVQREVAAVKKDAERAILSRWEELMGECPALLPRYIPGAIRDVGIEGTIEAVEATARSGVEPYRAIQYFCGCVRNARSRKTEPPQEQKPKERMVPARRLWLTVAYLMDAYSKRVHDVSFACDGVAAAFDEASQRLRRSGSERITVDSLLYWVDLSLEKIRQESRSVDELAAELIRIAESISPVEVK